MKQLPLQSSPHQMLGLSLVELMVSLAIGLMILAAVSTVFVSSKQTYTTQDRLARLQENARFAMQYLIRDIRRAGFYGCHDDIQSVKSTLNASAGPYDPFKTDMPIEGMNQASGTWYPSGVASKPHASMEPQTDAVSIRMLDPSSSLDLAKQMPNESATLFVDAGPFAGGAAPIKEGEIIMVTDCSTADILQVTHVQDGTGGDSGKKQVGHNAGNTTPPGNSTQKLSKSYGPPGASIMKFYNQIYFIMKNANGVPSLYRQTNGGAAQELVEGIESLQLLYGRDTDGDKNPDVFLPAGHATLTTQLDWRNVTAVRIGILARTTTAEGIEKDSRSYDVDDDGTDDLAAQNDRHARRVFLATVVVRNLQ